MSVITARDVEQAKGELVVSSRDVVTPLARERARDLGVALRVGGAHAPAAQAPKVELARQRARSEPAKPEVALPPSAALYRRGAPLPAHVAARPRVAVVGAGHVGASTAQRLAELDRFDAVTLVDVVPGLAAGIALDLWHGAALRGFDTRIEGSDDLGAIAGAAYLVVTAGKPRQPGMSRTDLTNVNAEIIRTVGAAVRAKAPDAVVVVVTNPLEEMTHLMGEVTGFPAERVLGMAGVLDASRFRSLVALTGVARPAEISAHALGSHGPEMVIPLSHASVRGEPLERLLDTATLGAIVERTRDSGAEVVKLLQKGSAYFSPAESAARMIRAMVTGDPEVLDVCVRTRGAYGTVDTRLGLPARLGPTGLVAIEELALRPNELAALRGAAERIAERIRALG
jgi:malate dehydrogenase